MQYLVIQNKGLIDPKALALMGASVKEEGSIGEFGSGLKYALATILREGLKFAVYSGDRKIEISVKDESFREQSFGVIHIDGQPTSITTRTGPKWTLREAIREIWSNAVDEGNSKWWVQKASDGPVHFPAGYSTFIIELNAEIQVMTENWQQYFVHDVPELSKNICGRVLEQPTTNYFRRGVWICEDRNLPALFSYDFSDIELPESRRVSSEVMRYNLPRLMRSVDEHHYWDTIINNLQGKWAEWQALSWSNSGDHLEQAFFRQYDMIGHEQNQKFIKKLPPGRILWTSGVPYDVLTNTCELPRVEIVSDYNSKYEIIPWPIGVEAKVRKEITFLAQHGIDLSKFDIRFAKFNSETVIAQADMKRKICLIGDDAFNASAQMLRKALIEEWTHLAHGVSDHTVDQQHVYLNLICDLISR
jgi:hypothetical protein